MKIYENGKNWLIEDQLDFDLVKKINDLLDNNLNNLLKIKKGYSTRGENAQQYWLIKKDNENNFYFQNKDFENIELEYRSKVLNRLKKSNILKENNQDKLLLRSKNCWAVIGEENSYHIPHFHNEGSFSGVSTLVYLKVPETNDDNMWENNLFLIMNSSANNEFYYEKPKIITINPVVGKILIFPDWIIHGTCPQTKGIRQTFNIDYYFDYRKDEKINKLNYV